MSFAVCRAMALTLLRDRSALIMIFALPPLIFFVFATAFSASGDARPRVRVAVHDAAGTAITGRLVALLDSDSHVVGTPIHADSVEAVRQIVRRGEADVGLVLRGNPVLPGFSPALPKPAEGEADAARPAPMLLVIDPSKGMATPVATEAVQSILTRLAAGIRPGDARAPQLIALENAVGGNPQAVTAAYYAGGVAILFLLFSAVQGAVTLIDERASGTLDRILSGPGGARHVIAGKFLFLLGQGTLQAALVFLLAWAVYGVDLAGRPGPWLLTTLVSAAVASGLALALAALCRTRQQAQAASTFLILLMSAVGGSMAPRFTMPPWLQNVGWFTPNAWVIEAYQDTLWRGEPAATLLPTWLGLAVLAGASLLFAIGALRWRSG